MARRFQTNPRTPQSLRRKTSWVGGIATVPTNELTVAGSTSVIFSALDTRLSANASLGNAFTVVRIRGFLTVTPLSITSPQFVTGAFGICIVNGEAFDAGVASVISPWTESFDDRWLYHTYFQTMDVFNAAGVAWFGHRIEIDSKAMCKVENGDVMISVFENASADSVSMFNNFRTLVKLA